MRILIENINENPANALRRCGYHFERQSPRTREISAARALGPGGFPKFHAYVKVIGDPSTIRQMQAVRGSEEPSSPRRGGEQGRTIRSGFFQMQIHLHLDQKRPSYKGTNAHGGEYDGEAIREEAERITLILSPFARSREATQK